MLKVVKDLGKSAVEMFKKASGVKRIIMILSTIALVDLLTKAAFYNFLVTGVVLFFVFRFIKNTSVYTVVSANVLKVIGKIKSAKSNG